MTMGGACWGTPLPESRGEKILFRPSWEMWRIFREISCGHFSWKLRGENLQHFRQTFAMFFTCRRKISPEFCSQEIRHKHITFPPPHRSRSAPQAGVRQANAPPPQLTHLHFPSSSGYQERPSQRGIFPPPLLSGEGKLRPWSEFGVFWV